jgi:hypothetical protein
MVGAKPIAGAKVAKECHELVYLRLARRRPWLAAGDQFVNKIVS